ncbi:nudC domain-containing protein 3 [Nymphalis io]|uniref:nudC domain-containing protein 3 n=1 Tax=Inachis io TaxID=171585 RepID=UPI0021687902|nr:nudC domain-containing protein 3 [Nymphalis io]
METNLEYNKYDEIFTSILEKEKSILGFLSAIFNFLARRTDFYYVHDGFHTDMGFPPGVAEELVIKVLRKCDPKNWSLDKDKHAEINNEIMCSTVAQEVEVIAQEDEQEVENGDIPIETADSVKKTDIMDDRSIFPEDYEPPIIVTQKNSESYNGAIRENYTWSQTIMDIDVTIKLPPDITSSKDLKVTINPGHICVARRNGDIILKDILPFKIKTFDSFWSISENRLLIHLEKVQERWWNKLLNEEEEIDLSKIDCSRPLDELPEDSIAKVRELQWNQEQKLKGLPTSDEIRNIEILKKAWNAEGSPFRGTEFNPNILKK